MTKRIYIYIYIYILTLKDKFVWLGWLALEEKNMLIFLISPLEDKHIFVSYLINCD